MNFNIFGSLKNFISNSKHVMSVGYKPSQDAFVRTIKVVLLGTLLLGVVGFIVSLVISFITTGGLP